MFLKSFDKYKENVFKREDSYLFGYDWGYIISGFVFCISFDNKVVKKSRR